MYSEMSSFELFQKEFHVRFLEKVSLSRRNVIHRVIKLCLSAAFRGSALAAAAKVLAPHVAVCSAIVSYSHPKDHSVLFLLRRPNP